MKDNNTHKVYSANGKKGSFILSSINDWFLYKKKKSGVKLWMYRIDIRECVFI